MVVGGLRLWAAATALLLLWGGGGGGGPAGAEAGRVLGVFYFPGRSHFVVFEALLKEMAARGHQVDVVSHFPQKKPLSNYRDISIAGSSPSMVDNWTFEEMLKYPFTRMVNWMWVDNVEICRKAMEHPALKKLVQNPEPYDVVLVEIFGVDCAYGYAYKVGAPVIGLTSAAGFPWGHARVGNPDNPSYSPLIQSTFSPHMTFLERFQNTVMLQYAVWGEILRGRRQTDQLLREQLGEDVPPLSDLLRNTSMVMVNSHFSLNGVRPTVPGYLEVGGMHLDANPGKLPEELSAFVEGSGPAGLLLVSFGSLVPAHTMPPQQLQAFLRVLGALPQRVVWRIDAARVPGGLPPNVLGVTWIPQQALLSHPKMRAFVTHGGLGAIQEAVYWGVPVVTVPFFSDQPHNGIIMRDHGAGRILQFTEITKDTLREALDAVLNDHNYRENAKKLQREFRDRPMTPLQTAVWWTEYVMRHKGAPQLRSVAVDMPWYQLWLLDVAAVVTAGVALVVAALWLLVRTFLRCLCGGSKKAKTGMRKAKTS